MISAYVLAGELAKAGGHYKEAFGRYEAILRAYISKKRHGAERFAAVFAPKTQWGLTFRNQVIKAFAIPGLARLAVGRDIIDALRLPEYRWPTPASTDGHAKPGPKKGMKRRRSVTKFRPLQPRLD